MSVSSPPPPPASSPPGPLPTDPLRAAKVISEQPSSAFSALEHTGIPKSWLKRPKLPSRNWLIFIGVVSSISYLYWDDRKKCKAIREEYVQKVKHFADVPLGTKELPRKVQVFACRWPGDDEYDRSMKYFRKYVKPILHAAAIDYDMKNGNHHGALASLVAGRAQDQRLAQLGLDNPKLKKSVHLPGFQAPRDLTTELEGGTVLIGRHTFKEYMHGLKRGWTDPLTQVDEDEALANTLQNDSHFDEPATVSEIQSPGLGDVVSDVDTAPMVTNTGRPSTSTPPSRPPTGFFSPLTLRKPSSPTPVPSPPQPTMPEYVDTPPPTIPPQPPLALVYYPIRLGFLNIPMMIADFFNERKNVRNGCEAAYRIVMSQSRPLNAPTSSYLDPSIPSDVDFAVDSEAFFRSSYGDTLKVTADSRKKFYAELPKKLEVARALARNEREPTKDEVTYPPPTEVELRETRFKKEKKWTAEESAYEFLKAGSGVAWDPRFEAALRVFRDPTSEEVQEKAPPFVEREWGTDE